MLLLNHEVGRLNLKDFSNRMPVMKNLSFVLFFLPVISAFSQGNIENANSFFPQDTFAQQNPMVIINDYAFMINEDSTYTFTIDFIGKIKNAYFIAAHTKIFDSTIYVKIIKSKECIGKQGEKIKVGDNYDMRLIRYYPYPLKHELDYYYNYNFLFGKKIIGLQATFCMTYIFTTHDLDGLRYVVEKNTILPRMLPSSETTLSTDSLANKIISAIIRRDKEKIWNYADSVAVMTSLKNFSEICSPGVVRHGFSQCIPKFKLKRSRYHIKKYRNLPLSEMLLCQLTDDFIYCTDLKSYNSSVKFLDTKFVHFDKKHVTYRVIWNLQQERYTIIYVTYLSFNTSRCENKMVGLSSFAQIEDYMTR